MKFKCLLAVAAALLVAPWGGSLGPSPAQAQTSPDQQPAFARALANPDAIGANLELLSAQLDAGDFEAASVTLQRILLQNPGFDEARLLRVAVFIRLGDDAAARSDLNILAERPLSEAQRGEAQRLSAHVASSPTDLMAHGVLRTGLMVSDNPGQRPGTFTLIGSTYDHPTQSAVGGFAQLEAVVEQPIGGAGHSMRAEVNGYVSDYFDSQRGASLGRLALGPRIDLGFAFVDVMGVAGVDFSGGHLYGSHVGGRVKVTGDLTERLSASLRVQAVHEQLDVDLFSTFTMGDGDGTVISVAPSATFVISTLWDISASAHYSQKDAGDEWYSYESFGGGLSVRYRDATGWQVRAGIAARSVEYDALNPNVIPASQAREETRYDLNLAAAAPVNVLLGALGQRDDQPWAADWSLEAFAGYRINESNIPVYDTSNWTVGLSVARRFSM